MRAAKEARSERLSPLSAFGNVGNKHRVLGAANAGSLVHRGGVFGTAVSASGCDGHAPETVHGPDGNDDSRVCRLRRARGVLCDRQSSDYGEDPSLVVGPHTTAPPRSGGDASSTSADTSVASTGGHDGSELGAARGVGKCDESLEARLRHASGTLCARQSFNDGANPSRFAGLHHRPAHGATALGMRCKRAVGWYGG